jgi:uncharacterized protein (DUF1810 family)
MTDAGTLQRFVDAQDEGGTYERAVAELRRGRKTTHWMWFVFPQLAGLGTSAMAQRYAIATLGEARDYAAHSVLGPRLRQCATVVLELPTTLTAEDVFGGVDAVKLRSSMTLFARAAPDEPAFRRVLGRFFAGEPDPLTDDLLGGT